MARKKPTMAQVQLHLQLYDLRREARLREARDWFLHQKSPEQGGQPPQPGSKEETFARMVISYWDQACLLVLYGLLHEEFFFQTTNEFFFVWERIKPQAPVFRQHFRNPHLCESLEKVSDRYVKWSERQAPGYLDAVRQYMKQFANA